MHRFTSNLSTEAQAATPHSFLPAINHILNSSLILRFIKKIL